MTRDRISQISEKTLMPLGMVFVVIGATAWLSQVSSKADANTRAIEELKAKQAEYNNVVQAINTRLANIEGKLSK